MGAGGVGVGGGGGKLASRFRGGKKNWRRDLGGAKKFKKIFLFQSQFNRYILGLNRHVHSTLIKYATKHIQPDLYLQSPSCTTRSILTVAILGHRYKMISHYVRSAN